MNNKLSKNSFFPLCVSVLLGGSLAAAGGVMQGEKIGYITVFASFLLYIPLLFLYFGIFKRGGSTDIFKASENILGKTAYKIFLTVSSVYCFFTALVSSREFFAFASLSSNLAVSPVVISLTFSACIYFIMLCGKQAVSGYTMIMLPFVMLLLGVTMLFGIPKFDTANLNIENIPDFGYIGESVFLNFVSPFSNIFIVYLLMQGTDKKSIKRKSVTAGLFTLFVIALVYVWNLLIIGKNLMNSLYFPSLYTLGAVNPNLFTERSESVFLITYIFFYIVFVSASYLAAFSCIFRLFDKKNTPDLKIKGIVYLIPLALTFTAMTVNINTQKFHASFLTVTAVSACVTVGIPIILFLVSYIKNNRSPAR